MFREVFGFGTVFGIYLISQACFATYINDNEPILECNLNRVFFKIDIKNITEFSYDLCEKCHNKIFSNTTRDFIMNNDIDNKCAILENITAYTDICHYIITEYENNTVIKVPVNLIINNITNSYLINCYVEISFLSEYYENLEKVNSSTTNFDDDNNNVNYYKIKLLKVLQILVITVTVILVFSILMCVFLLKCVENTDNS